MQSAVYLVAVWSVWHGGSSRRLVLGIAAVALLMRVPVVLAPPYLSSDVYRYVWDGRDRGRRASTLTATCPTDPHLAALRDPDIFPQINRATTALTIYPPVAEAIFSGGHPRQRVGDRDEGGDGRSSRSSPLPCSFACSPPTACRPARVVVYAWHPLPLWEFAGSGHIDAALIALRRRRCGRRGAARRACRGSSWPARR